TRRFPALVRPSLVSGHAWDEEDTTRFLGQLEDEPITCLAGPADRVSAFLDQARRRNGNDLPCPGLVAVLYSRSRPGFAADELRPPALRVVPAALPSPHIMAGPPRPRSAGSPAGLPEMSFHSPWSGRADRG